MGKEDDRKTKDLQRKYKVPEKHGEDIAKMWVLSEALKQILKINRKKQSES